MNSPSNTQINADGILDSDDDNLVPEIEINKFSSAVDGILGIDFYGAVLLQSFAKPRPTI